MALKYQALNGTVISKTTTIQGIDLSKRGTPQLLGGLPTVEGIVFPFCGMTANTGRVNTTLSSSTSISVSYPKGTISSVNINGVIYYGFSSAEYFFYSYDGSTTNSYTLNGKFIIVKAKTNSGIIVEELPVNMNITSSTEYKGIQLTVSKESNDLILSITFEPTT